MEEVAVVEQDSSKRGKMHKTYVLGFITILSLLLLQACTELDSKTIQRVNSLYAHSLLMKENGTPEQLKRVGLDTSYIVEDASLTPKNKIERMENAFGIWPNGNDAVKVKGLEDKMTLMMERWNG
jgi:hypothetical protein